MAKNLVIVESPAKAKTIENFLGKEFVVKSSIGHIRDMPKKDMGINLENDFEPTYVVSQDKKKVVADLRKTLKTVDKVYLVDKIEPPSRKKLIAIAESVAPWISNKLVNISEKISTQSSFISLGMTVVSAHACGTLTDLCIDIAEVAKGHVALMPCCYPKKQCKAPITLQVNLGFENAFDIDRTYRLEQMGYKVKWQSIPSSISPMNRVIIAKK